MQSTDMSRRGGAPAGDDYISLRGGVFDLGQSYSMNKLYLAYLYGSSRCINLPLKFPRMEKRIQGVLTTQSSGKTDDFEEFDLGGVKARYIKYLGGGNSSNSYNSVGELQVTERNKAGDKNNPQMRVIFIFFFVFFFT